MIPHVAPSLNRQLNQFVAVRAILVRALWMPTLLLRTRLSRLSRHRRSEEVHPKVRLMPLRSPQLHPNLPSRRFRQRRPRSHQQAVRSKAPWAQPIRFFLPDPLSTSDIMYALL